MAKKNTEETKVNTNEEVVNNAVASPTVAPEVAPTATTEPETVTTTTVKEAPKAAKAKTSKADKEFDALVEDTMNGVHGTGRERMLALGSNYSKVQQEITRRIRAK